MREGGWRDDVEWQDCGAKEIFNFYCACTSKVPTFCSYVRHIKPCVLGEDSGVEPHPLSLPGSCSPIAIFYHLAGCSLSWLLQSPRGRAVFSTLIFSGLFPAQGCPVCEDARTPSAVLPITRHLKGLAFCLDSCKELAQLRFSHTGEECRKAFFFLPFSPFELQETVELNP